MAQLTTLTAPSEATLLRVSEVAARLGVSARTVRRLVAAGRLGALRYQDRGALVIPESDVRELLERSRVHAEAA